MTPIQNLIFDLGGVIINLRRENAVEALTALGIPDMNEILGLYRQQEPVLSLETGRCTSAEFYDNMRRLANTPLADKDIERAFCSFLVDLPVQRLRALQDLRNAGYRVFMLSNTNPVMFNSWIAEHFRADGGNVNDYFDGIVTSFQELTCKPDPEIFQTVLRRYGLTPEATIMLDDSDANCKAAQSTGMHAIRIDNTDGPSFMDVASMFLEIAATYSASCENPES